MTYSSGLGAGGVSLMDLPPITAIEPSPLPAGPGKQVVVVHSAGMRDGFNLGVSPVDFGAIQFPTTQGYSAPLYGISADGTVAHALVDLRGNVAEWSLQIISPYTNQQSPEYRVSSVAGGVAPYDTMQYAFDSGQLTPILVIAETRLVASQNSAGQPTNYNVVTGGSPGGAFGIDPNKKFPTAGVLVNVPGAWRFIPAGPDAARIVSARMPQCVPNLGNCYNGQADCFGLPIVTPNCPGDLAWVDLSGNLVTSPWSTGAPPVQGSVIQQDSRIYYGEAGNRYQPPAASSGQGGDVVDTDPTALVPSATDPSGSALPNAAPVPPAPYTAQVLPIHPSSVPPATLLLVAGVLAYLATSKRGQ